MASINQTLYVQSEEIQQADVIKHVMYHRLVLYPSLGVKL